MLRRACFAVVSMVVGLGLACLLVEAGFRVAGAIQDVDYRIYLQELKNPDSLPLAIWVPPPDGAGNLAEQAFRRYPPFRPHAHVLATTADFSAIYRINGRGLRDREYPLPKPPGVRRVLAFGDSFTFGSGVADDERFTEVAEDALDGVEIVNMGVPGYGLDQILLSFLAQGRAWQPDDVVVFLNGHVANRHLTGIVYDGAVHVPSDLAAVDFSGEAGDTFYLEPGDPLLRSRVSWLERNSYALAFLSYRLQLGAFQARFAKQSEQRWSRQRMLGRRALGADPDIKRRARTRLLVEALRDAVRDAGARLTVVNIDRQHTAGYLTNVEGIRLVDLAPELNARGQVTELTFRYDQHYNANTHRWIGERVRALLAESAS